VSASPECLKSCGESQRLRTGSPARCCTAPWVGFVLSFVHPQLIQFGRLVLPTYGFLVALGVLLALAVCMRTARLLSLDTDKIWSVALLAIVTALVGRILVLLLRWPGYTFSVGLAGAAAAVVYTWRLGLPVRRTADAFAPSLALGSAVVAVACLEAGCDYGTPTHLPWAVIFNSPAAVPGTPLGVPLHPTQLYAGLVEFVLFVLLLWLLHRPHYDGEILGSWLFLGGLAHFLLTSFRGDDVVAAQLIGAAMVLGGGLLWLHRPQVAHGG
jgi:phosphatidylglycerol---prolipoprotein diacylglyceryl transferase